MKKQADFGYSWVKQCFVISPCSDQKEKLMQENKDLQSRYLESKQELDELKNRMNSLTEVKSSF